MATLSAELELEKVRLSVPDATASWNISLHHCALLLHGLSFEHESRLIGND